MTNAYVWAMIRECWLTLSPVPDSVKNQLMSAMEAVRPTYIPNPSTSGDQGTVDFADGSSITWDWDNGDFELPDGPRLTYPSGHDDPLDFKF